MQRLLARRAAGFSLTELVVVLAVISIIAAIAVPTFSNVRTNAASRAAVSSAESVAKNAFALAVQESTSGSVSANDFQTGLAMSVAETDQVTFTNGSSDPVSVEDSVYTWSLTHENGNDVTVSFDEDTQSYFVGEPSVSSGSGGSSSPAGSAAVFSLLSDGPTIFVNSIESPPVSGDPVVLWLDFDSVVGPEVLDYLDSVACENLSLDVGTLFYDGSGLQAEGYRFVGFGVENLGSGVLNCYVMVVLPPEEGEFISEAGFIADDGTVVSSSEQGVSPFDGASVFQLELIVAEGSYGEGAPAPDGSGVSSGDSTPPSVQSISISPTTVDVNDGPVEVTVSVQVTDDLSGVSWGNVRLQSPSGSYLYFWLSLEDGTNLNGLWEGVEEIGEFAESGTWNVTGVVFYDFAGNMLELFGEAEIALLNGNTSITVQ
jgi:prepilin-type N-terminal cleavage/methylation domain-containing protein